MCECRREYRHSVPRHAETRDLEPVFSWRRFVWTLAALLLIALSLACFWAGAAAWFYLGVHYALPGFVLAVAFFVVAVGCGVKGARL